MSWKNNIIIHHKEVSKEYRCQVIRQIIDFAMKRGETNEKKQIIN